MARRPTQPEHHEQQVRHPSDAPSPEWEARLEIIIAIALGLAAIVTAGAVYLNEHQEHKAEVDFHQATHRLLSATTVGLRTPAGHALELSSTREVQDAEGHQAITLPSWLHGQGFWFLTMTVSPLNSTNCTSLPIQVNRLDSGYAP